MCAYWQVKYAALDALLTGMLYRALKELQATSDKCQACKTLLWTVLPAPDLKCSCGKIFGHLRGLRSHAAKKGHTYRNLMCFICKRPTFDGTEAASALESETDQHEHDRKLFLQG